MKKVTLEPEMHAALLLYTFAGHTRRRGAGTKVNSQLQSVKSLRLFSSDTFARYSRLQGVLTFSLGTPCQK